MKLRKTESVCVLNDKGVCVGNIYSCFYNGGAYEDINFVFEQLSPYLAEFFFTHFAVAYTYSCIGEILLDLCRTALDAVDAVEKVVNLTSSAKLSLHCFGEYTHILSNNVGLNRVSSRGCNFKQRHITNSRHSHIESTGNRCSRKGQHINTGELFLELFFLKNTEALLFINDKQT